MVTKGIPWADLPAKHRGQHEYVPAAEPAAELGEIEERSPLNDAKAILKRATFGMVSGSLAGASFGFVDVLRDTKAMSQRKKVVTTKVLQYTYKCGGIFAGYHAARKSLKLYEPCMSNEVNVATATGITMAPLIAFKALRPIAPYAVVLIILDCLNGINDI